MEVKLATLSAAGTFTFNQLRRQKYQYVVLLGVAPTFAHCWVIKKSDLWVRGRVGPRKQHGGQAARDTWMLNVAPGYEPKWLQSRGGALLDALQILKGL